MNVLVIKTGHSETLAWDPGGVPSLGDVLRTTPLLPALREKYEAPRVDWLVAPEATPLLEGNPQLDELLIWEPQSSAVIAARRYDVVVNLGKQASLCVLSEMIPAAEKYGFRQAPDAGKVDVYPGSERLSDCLGGKVNGAGVAMPWQQVLIETLGVRWAFQPYQLGYRPKGDELHDVGLNHVTGPKWPRKAMPKARWEGLAEELAAAGYSVSWQRGLRNLDDYMEWVHSCHIVISTDSLGLHLALALDKRVVGLFGPTDPREIHGYGRARSVAAPSPDRLDWISLEKVVAATTALHACP